MTIYAVAPTGRTWYRPPQPIWRFSITNTGGCVVVWEAGVELRTGNDEDYSHAGGHVDWPGGVLAPGQSALTNMIVPGRNGSVWRGYIEFWPVSAEDLKKAQRESGRLVDVPVSQLCPRPQGTKRVFKDEWRH